MHVFIESRVDAVDGNVFFFVGINAKSIKFTFSDIFAIKSPLDPELMPTEISNKFTLIDILYTMLYIHVICISVFPDTDGCTVKGKCYKSQKRNESPHDEKVNIFNLLCHTNLFFAFVASSLHITCISHSPIHLLHTLILNYKLNKYIYYDWVK